METVKEVELTLDRLFYQTLSRRPDEELAYKESKVPYKTMFRNVLRTSDALYRSGLKGRRVAVLDWNTPEFAELLYAIPLAGAAIHPVNVRLPPEEMLKTMKFADDRAVFFSSDFLPLIKKVESLGWIPKERLFFLGQGDAASFRTHADLSASGSEGFEPGVKEDDEASVLFTSGTTGDPKGVSYSHKKTLLAGWTIATLLSAYKGNARLRSDDVVMSLIPFYHLWSWGTLYFSTMLGNRYVMDGRFDPNSILQAVAREHVTWMSMVPTMLYSLLVHRDAEVLRGIKVLIGGSPVPSGLVKSAEAKGIELAMIYGFTDGLIASIATVNEGLGPLSTEARNEISVTSTTPAPLSEVRILKPDEGSPGEVLFRSPWLPPGYFTSPDKTRESFDYEGWFHPGDAGELDAYGNLRILDRTKDLIKSGAEFIPSAKVESALSEAPGVELVAVVGRADPKWGERPVAFIKPKANVPFDPVKVKEHLESYVAQGKLNRWWIPEEFLPIDDMPMTGTGKLDKKKLRERLAGR
jgi:acyl-CoA synthetase (AMP-forming)/AMP-acid ligase II